MRNITIKLVALFGLLPAAMAAGAAQKVNPTTQINWPLATGTTSPSASCTSSIYGQPYTNRSTGDFYVCAVSGWVLVAGGGGGGVGGSGTTGFYALWTAATTLGNGSLDDGVTTAGFDTFSKPVQVICSTCATQVDLTYNSGHAPTPGSSTTASFAPNTSGQGTLSEAGAAYDRICTHSNGQCTGGGGGGGYTNVTGSISETTVALINTACGSGTYYATTALSIATGGTITCPVQFSKAGVMTVASGQTVTFAKAVTKTDAPTQIFAGSGVVVLAAQDAPVEWWGAVADGNYGASTGTDNAAAINACITSLTAGRCLLLGNGIYRVASAVSIAKSWVGIAGPNEIAGTVVSSIIGACNSTCIFTDQAGIDIVDVHGTNGPNVISGNTLENLSQSLVPTASNRNRQLRFLASNHNRHWA